MASWKNDPLVLYHGCSELSLRPRNQNGIAADSKLHYISLLAGGHRTEFGRGFYATTWLRQAEFWANRQARKAAISRQETPRPKATVLRFEVGRNDLAHLESLVFTNENAGFWPFISYCRSGLAPHGRQQSKQQEYDIVYGPVSIWPQQLVIKDCDQVSFHTDKALSVISAVSVTSTGNPYY